MNDVLARLREMQAGDLPVHGGRTLAYVYDSGLAEVDEVGRAAVAAYAGSNGLDPTAFPSLLTMENELVGFACDPPRRAGHGGRHGHLRWHRVGAARRPGRPRRAPGDHRAADGDPVDRARGVPQGRALLRRRGGVGAGRARLPRRRRRDGRGDRRPHRARGRPARRRTPTASWTRSPRSPPPRPRAGSAATSTPASAAGCCRTPPGWGARSPPWTFAVEGVTSISVDLHKYAYAPKGTSILLHRTPALRRAAVLRQRGLAGLHDAQRHHAVHEVRRPAGRGVGGREHPGRRGLRDAVGAGVRGRRPDRRRHRRPAAASSYPRTRRWSRWPPTTRATRSRSATRWRARGWYVQPQMSYAGSPATIHLSVSAATLGSVEDFLDRARRRGAGGGGGRAGAGGPGRGGVHRGTRPGGAVGRRLRRAARGQRAGRRAPASGGLDLPERMAEVNALLDVASPAMREALLKAFLDRLSRPTR